MRFNDLMRLSGANVDFSHGTKFDDQRIYGNNLVTLGVCWYVKNEDFSHFLLLIEREVKL
jgi:hypothetical protein